MGLKNSLRKMIYAHYTGKHEQFTEAVREIVASERGNGHNRIADDLEQALADASQPSLVHQSMRQLSHSYNYPHSTKSIPVSKGDNLPLVEIKHPSLTFEDIVLDSKTKKRVDRIVYEQTKRSSLAKYGLQPISKILFYGPPGCGKTLAAHTLAGVLGWPLLYTRFDSVISSYLGETSLNLSRVFEFAKQGPCILFFDEFDAIGKSREEQGDVGELKRVVNAFLQMMDNYLGDSLIIAATNHEQLLDKAVWRRFDEIIHFTRPATKEIEGLLRMRLSRVRLHNFSPRDLLNSFSDLTYSDITYICLDAIKQMVLSERASLTKEDVLNSLNSFKESRPSV